MKKTTILCLVFFACIANISIFGQTAKTGKTDKQKEAWVKNNPEEYQKQLNELKEKLAASTKKDEPRTEEKAEVKTISLQPKGQETILLEREIEANKNNPNYDLKFKQEKLRQAKTFEIQ